MPVLWLGVPSNTVAPKPDRQPLPRAQTRSQLWGSRFSGYWMNSASAPTCHLRPQGGSHSITGSHAAPHGLPMRKNKPQRLGDVRDILIGGSPERKGGTEVGHSCSEASRFLDKCIRCPQKGLENPKEPRQKQCQALKGQAQL